MSLMRSAHHDSMARAAPLVPWVMGFDFPKSWNVIALTSELCLPAVARAFPIRLHMLNIELDEIEQTWRNSSISRVEPADLLLVTDFDGTLSEIGPNPAQSEALPEALPALRRLVALLKG